MFAGIAVDKALKLNGLSNSIHREGSEGVNSSTALLYANGSWSAAICDLVVCNHCDEKLVRRGIKTLVQRKGRTPVLRQYFRSV